MKRWLRREVLTPLLFLALYGGALYLLTRKLQQLQILNQRGLMTWLLVASVVVYVVLLVTTIHHLSTVYLLQRFDPGDPRSIRRLARKRRFQLPENWDAKVFAHTLPSALLDFDFELESGEPRTGLVYARSGVDFWTRRPVLDRVLVLETSSINVFRVDQLLKETVERLDHVERPSRRNVLAIVVRMPGRNEVASAAAGCVNFLGRFQSGTLFPILIDITHKRLYYPVNRSFISREHRSLYNRLLSLVRSAGRHRDEGQSADRILSSTVVQAGAPVAPAPTARPVSRPEVVVSTESEPATTVQTDREAMAKSGSAAVDTADTAAVPARSTLDQAGAVQRSQKRSDGSQPDTGLNRHH